MGIVHPVTYPGRHGGHSTPWYTYPGRHGGHSTPCIYTPRYTMVGIPASLPYSLLYHPGYTRLYTVELRTGSAVQGVVQCGAKRALGSKRRIVRVLRRIELPNLPKV